MKANKRAKKKITYRFADVFQRKVNNLLVHGPFVIRLHDRFLRGQTHQIQCSWEDIRMLCGQNDTTTNPHTLKYIGAISPSSRGSGIHSKTMCCLLRGFICVSMNTQSRSWDSNIRTKLRRNSCIPQSKTEVKSVICEQAVWLSYSTTVNWLVHLYLWPDFLIQGGGGAVMLEGTD